MPNIRTDDLPASGLLITEGPLAGFGLYRPVYRVEPTSRPVNPFADLILWALPALGRWYSPRRYWHVVAVASGRVVDAATSAEGAREKCGRLNLAARLGLERNAVGSIWQRG